MNSVSSPKSYKSLTINSHSNQQYIESDDVSLWSLNDYINKLTDIEKKNILHNTEKYILQLTEDRAGPYWKNRVQWINAMLNKQFYEPISVTNKIIYNLRGFDLTFDFIITNNLYSYLVCDSETERYKSKKNYNYDYLLEIAKKISTSQPVTTEEKKIYDTEIYNGENIGKCLTSFYRYFKKKQYIDGNLDRRGQGRRTKQTRKKRKNTKKQKSSRRSKTRKQTKLKKSSKIY